ncbi:MAG: hypothetical protein HYY06_29870, partial [Deltaproteobacteria bacterium]|nr:hypothetical protein [Deltaproteobacteria bacterium]
MRRGLAAALALGASFAACGDDDEGIGEDTLDRCTDNVDNDHDGLVDCRDPRCQIFARCVDDDGGPDGDSDSDS